MASGASRPAQPEVPAARGPTKEMRITGMALSCNAHVSHGKGKGLRTSVSEETTRNRICSGSPTPFLSEGTE